MGSSVIIKNVTKKYKLYKKPTERLLDLLLPKSYGEDFYALRDISFEADKGDVIGFVGINGSGKSTLLNILANIIPQTSGVVNVKGKSAIIAVASGMNNELTGRENIELKLLMLGFNKKEIQRLEPEIIDFSELGKFIDQPVKSYSSGMKSRLGFSISVNIDPDVLIIDEALSVGDKTFSEKSFQKILDFKQQGKTIFFVSHSNSQMKQFCEKVIWLEFGHLKMYDKVEKVLPAYEKFLKEYKAMSKIEQKKFREDAFERRSKAESILK